MWNVNKTRVTKFVATFLVLLVNVAWNVNGNMSADEKNNECDIYLTDIFI